MLIYKTVCVYYGEELKEIPPVPEKKDAGDRTYTKAWCSDEQGTPADFTSITADMTVYAVYTAYYTVTLEGGTGYMLMAASGSTSPVKEGGSFGFCFVLEKGYQKTKMFVVKVNGINVELTAEGTYEISDIRENKVITVEGVKKKGSSGNHGSGDTSGGDTTPGDDTKTGDGTKLGNDTKPGDGTTPGDDMTPGDGTKLGDDTTHDDDINPEDGNPPIDDDMPIIPVVIEDGKIVIGGGNIIGGGDVIDDGNTRDGGSIATGNIPSMAGTGLNPENGMTAESTISTMLKLEDGAVIVTVVCNSQNCTAGVAEPWQWQMRR